MLNNLDIKYFKLAVGQENIGKESSLDINARCPVCGDSSKKKSSKRLHLYNKNNRTSVNCFNGNCEVQNKSVYGFIKEFFPSLLEQYKRENFQNNISKAILDGKQDTNDVFENIKTTNITKITTVNLEHCFHGLETEVSRDALKYIKLRGYDYNINNPEFGKWYYCKTDLKIDDIFYRTADSLVIPLYKDNKMYGFYSRKLREKNFATYMHQDNIGYKIFNWFNINKEVKTYIFEGIFDAISSGYSNIISALGAKIPQDRIDELQEPIFCLDNDRTGLINSLEYSKKGYGVVIFPDNIKEKDYNELHLNNPSLNIKEFIRENTFYGIMAEVRIKEKL